VAITGGLAPLAEAVGQLLAPASPHWYESRWAWAGAAALVAAAIAIPFTAAFNRNGGPSTWTVKPVYSWP
jgi:hypothetical protein